MQKEQKDPSQHRVRVSKRLQQVEVRMLERTEGDTDESKAVQDTVERRGQLKVTVRLREERQVKRRQEQGSTH